MVLLAIILIGVGALMIYTFIRVVNYLLNPIINRLETKQSAEEGNYYINLHKVRRENDKQYEEYLKWMDENNASLPVDKLKTKEEREFEREINSILNKK